MSAHLWTSRRITPVTTALGTSALRMAMRHGASAEAAVRFAGYYLETVRQKARETVHSVWAGAERSNHRYARGRNADNYLTAGALVVAQLAPLVGLTADAPWAMVMDKLIEEDLLNATAE